jgi:glucosamine--fructose-6-phosphate aminotransferase (isomerizing)
MCGIVGVKTSDDAAGKVFNGLKRLEYRGYDSAGIATLDDNSMQLEKKTGQTENKENKTALDILESQRISKKMFGSVSLGHTRWATHGGVTEANAHPHTDCSNEIAVVHNGIIQNYEELKEELRERGHKFRSETDTEVIPHLIEEYYNQGDKPREACKKAVDRLEGSYAIAAAFPNGDIVGFKQDSPLAIGVGEDEFFLASDITAFIDYTDKAVYLEDGDLALLNSSLEIFRDGEEIEVEPEEIEWDAEQASKAGYDHYMQKEIREQPTTIKRAAFQDKSDLKKAVEMLDEAENIYITGCGTASYAAALGAKYLRKAGHQVEFEQAHELEYRTDEIGENDVVIAVSQSGETADLLATLKQNNADTLAIVNVVGSTLARKARHKLFVNAGPEIGVASTKAFTGQVTVLRLLGYAAENRIDEGRENLVQLAEEVNNVIGQNEEEIEELSEYLQEKKDAYFIGRDRGREMAFEAALKLKELSYIHAEGFPGGEFKHGTLALIEEGIPVFTFLNHHEEEILSNGIEARSRGADLIGVGDEDEESFEYFVEVPDVEDSEILEIIPFQMLAYRTAVKKGHNPDKPRNLAKSVTVK